MGVKRTQRRNANARWHRVGGDQRARAVATGNSREESEGEGESRWQGAR